MISHWPILKLGDIVQDLTDERAYTISSEEEISDPTINSSRHTITIAQKKVGSAIQIKKRIKIYPGDLVFSRLHTQNGAFAFSRDCFQATGTFIPLKINENIINRQYLFWALHVKVPKLATTDSVGRETYKTNDILEIGIPVPTLEEQLRIVNYIEKLNGKIRDVIFINNKIEKYTSKLFNSALADSFNNLYNNKYDIKNISDVSKLERGRFSHRPRNDPRFYGGNIPFIQIGDISRSKIYVSDYSQTLNQDGLKISKLFPIGTVVIAITGATIGVTGILEFDSCFPDSIVGIQPKKNIITSEFLYLNIEYAKENALSTMTQTTQPNINLKDLNRIQIILPPTEVQYKISDYLFTLYQKNKKIHNYHQIKTMGMTKLLERSLISIFE